MAAPVLTVSLCKPLERVVAHGHPWIYRDALKEREIPAGKVVTVLDRRGRFLARGLAEAGPEAPAVLLFTRGDDREVLFAEEQAAWCERWPGLEVRLVDGVDESDPASWAGFLDAARDALASLDRRRVQVWMAGHAAWIKPLRAELRERFELDRRQVKAEIFWP